MPAEVAPGCVISVLTRTQRQTFKQERLCPEKSPQSSKEHEEIALLKTELQGVRKEMKMEQLKNHVNEVIIDENEKTLHIQIRKM